MSAFKLLSLLLSYPDDELLAARGELLAAAGELPSGPTREAIAGFVQHLLSTPALELQQEYVATFDFHKRSTLFLSFYAYGDRRQRGLAMVELGRRYRRAGLVLRGGELPDHLPVMLEFAAHAPEGAGEAVLNDFRPALELVRVSLREERSPYAALLDALCAELPPLSADDAERARSLALAGPPTEEVGLEPFAPPEVMPAPAGCATGAAR